MATMAEISAALNHTDIKKQNLHKSFLDLQSQSPSSFNLPFNWSDLDSYFTTLQSSLQSKFNLLQILHPPPDPPTVPTRLELKSFCENSDGLGLIRFIALSPDRPTILSELSDAYRFAPNAPAMVLNAAAPFYSRRFKGTELREFWICCSFMLEALIRVKPDVTIEMKDKAMEIAIRWNRKVSRSRHLKLKNQKALGFLLLIEAYGLVDRFNIDQIINCVLIVAINDKTIDMCRRIIPANYINNLIQKLIDKEWYSIAVKFIIQLKKTDEFRPFDLSEEQKLRSMRVIEETRMNEKDLQNAVMKREIKALKSIIRCIDENHLESEYSKDSLVELVKKLEDEVENRKQTCVNTLGSTEQPTKPNVESAVTMRTQNVKLIQESHSQKSYLLPSSPHGSGPTGYKASSAEDNVVKVVNELENDVENGKQTCVNNLELRKQPVRAIVLKRQLVSESKMSKKSKKPELNKDQPTVDCSVTICPSSDRTLVLARPKLKSFCQNSDGSGLTRFIALAPDQQSILSELPDAYRVATDAPAMVLDAAASFYRPGFKGTELCSYWSGFSCMLEGLLRVKPDVTIEMKDNAMEIAVQWNQKRVSGSSRGNVNERKAFGFLLFIEAYKLVDRFSIDDIIDCFIVVAKKRHSIDLLRRLIPANKINDMIQKLIRKDMYVTVANICIELRKTDEFPPVRLLEDQKLRSMKVIEETCRNEKDLTVYNAVTMKEIRALKSIIRCIDENHLESDYPKDNLVELVNKLENDVENCKQTLVSDLGSRKQPKRATALKKQLMMRSKKPKLRESQPTVESPPLKNVKSIQESRSQKSDLPPDHVGKCHDSLTGSGHPTGSNAASESPIKNLNGPKRAGIDYSFIYVPQLCPLSGQNSNGWISD